MAIKYPRQPKHPERVCWGCERLCPADSMACGNGKERTEHLCETFGDDWYDWAPAPTQPDAPDVPDVPVQALLRSSKTREPPAPGSSSSSEH